MDGPSFPGFVGNICLHCDLEETSSNCQTELVGGSGYTRTSGEEVTPESVTAGWVGRSYVVVTLSFYL